ncbi:MAG TPA: ABC transporter substrate-binding protein, partial [Mycobacterium sp.]|nr:ABC transporter substrate-binding protein [Mycobacterium sp.]
TTGWEDIGSIDGAGTTSCVIHYSKVYEGYLTLIDPVYSAKWLQSVPVKDAPTKLNPLTSWKTAIYSGPYIVTNVKTNAEIDYAPNPNWATIGGHAPYLDKLIFKYYTDADAELAGYKNGEFDVGNDFNHADLPKLAGLPQNEVVALDALEYELNQLNNASLAKKFGAADVPTIKKAILLSYNKSEITDRILGGTVKPSSNFLSPVLWYYKDEPQTTQDFAQANSLLDGAGWVKGSDGIRAKNGVKLQILACTTTRQYRIDTLTLVASWLKQIGIQVTVKPVPAQPDFFGGWNQASKDTPCNLQHGNYDLGEFAWSYSPDPIVSYNVYHSSGIPDNPPHSGQNTTRTNDPAVDKAYDTVKGSVDPAVIKQAMFDFQDLYAKDIIEIPLFNWKEVWLVNPKLQNFVANPTQYTAEWNTGDWWVQQ